MSVSAITAPGRVGKVLPAGRYRMSGLLRSEWTKMRTVRSTMWTLGVTVVLAIGLSAIALHRDAHRLEAPGDAVGFDPTSTSLIGVFVAQFTIGILGVLDHERRVRHRHDPSDILRRAAATARARR